MRRVTNRQFFLVLAATGFALSLVSSAPALDWFDDFDDGDVLDGSPVTWTTDEIGFTPGMVDASTGTAMSMATTF